MLRRKLLAELRSRYALLSSQIWRKIVDENAFGVQKHSSFLIPPSSLLENAKKYRFQYDPQAKQAFMDWLAGKIAAGEVYDPYELQKKGGLGGTVKWSKERAEHYVYSAYRQGVVNAWNTGAKQNPSTDYDVTSPTDFTSGSREQFLNDAFNGPVAKKTLELLYTRAYDQFEGVDSEMARKMSRILSDGFLRGEGPREIARKLRNEVGMTKERALRIARTEIIHAQAEGQLDAMEMLGHDRIGVLAEYSTAHNDAVCPKCAALDGLVMEIADARGLIPVHPNCRCTFVPHVGKKPSARELAKSKKITDAVKAGRGPLKSPPKEETADQRELRKRQEAIERMERISPTMAQELRKKWDMDYDPAAAAKIEEDLAQRVREAEAAVREIEKQQMELYRREMEEKIRQAELRRQEEQRRHEEEIASLKLEIQQKTQESGENSRNKQEITPEQRKVEEKAAKEIFGNPRMKVDYSGMDYPLVEHTNAGLREVVEQYPFLRDAVKKIDSYTPEDSGTLAEFMPGIKNLLISSEKTLEDVLTTVAENYKIGYYATDSPQHTVRHEMGHALHDFVFTEIQRTQGLRAAQKFDDELTDLFAELVKVSTSDNDILSGRGKVDFDEMIAESFAEVMGEKPREFARKVIAMLFSRIVQK